ncbi:MAG: hypothetical protein WA210_16155, partial [Burkholderiaceae bacterium]
ACVNADDAGGELRLRWDARRANSAGPLAAANSLVPGITAPASNATLAEAELRGIWRAPATDAMRASIAGNAVLAAERREPDAANPTRTTHSHGRVNEWFAAGDFGAWQASAGKKIVAWDVGYGFRPNDVVQQEARRSLLSTTPEGRPLVEIERYGAQTAGALVWVNPNRANASLDEQRGASESALAARGYARDGATDWYAFGRWGQHTRASLGAALAWVPSDELELHASARMLQRHDGWQLDPQAGTTPAPANPWRQATLGGMAQGLLGASWTGEQHLSLLVEWWYDGTTLADHDWAAWSARNRALAVLGGQTGRLPATPVAGNLAWQATPFAASNLRRNNAFARLAWQATRWVLSIDALVTPSDRGHVTTAALQWQGEHLRLNAAWRVVGGPADALLAQLPQNQTAMLAVTWPF